MGWWKMSTHVIAPASSPKCMCAHLAVSRYKHAYLVPRSITKINAQNRKLSVTHVFHHVQKPMFSLFGRFRHGMPKRFFSISEPIQSCTYSFIGRYYVHSNQTRLFDMFPVQKSNPNVQLVVLNEFYGTV